MTLCSGVPAQERALAYLEGSLSGAEMDRFEEHYLDCPACLAQVQTMVALRRQLAKQLAVAVERAQPKRAIFVWPRLVWAACTAASLLVASVLTHRMTSPNLPQPAIARQPQPGLETASASQLADLTLPVYLPRALRGESEEPHFATGMRAYQQNDCRAAVASLSQVPASTAELHAARFYAGACQLRLGDLAAAKANLSSVAEAGESPQQEGALYNLAQVELAGNDPVTAHRTLLHIIMLRGDYERRARVQDDKVLQLIDRQRQAGAGGK